MRWDSLRVLREESSHIFQSHYKTKILFFSGPELTSDLHAHLWQQQHSIPEHSRQTERRKFPEGHVLLTEACGVMNTALGLVPGFQEHALPSS